MNFLEQRVRSNVPTLKERNSDLSAIFNNEKQRLPGSGR